MIVPAILTDNKKEFTAMLNACARFTNFVQVDIMDGEFVPSKSITSQELIGLESPVGSEAHLMVENPVEWIEPFKSFGAKRIIFHFEFAGDHLEVIEKITAAGMEAGIAVNPSTPNDSWKFLVDKIDFVLFMSVNPGFYGAPFIPEVLEKIRRFRKDHYDKILAIDGGVKLDNLAQVAESGVNYICVGSAILKQDDPKEAFLKFSGVLNG